MATNYKKWDQFAADLSDSDEDTASKNQAPKHIGRIPPAQAKEILKQAKTAGGSKPSSDSPPAPTSSEEKKKQEEAEQAMLAAQLQSGKKKYEKRKKVAYQGRIIYEWEQTLEEVDVYITPPPGVSSRDIVCDIKATHLKVGLKGAPFFLDEKLGGRCVKGESYWMLEDGVLHINLQKAKCGEAWMGATQHQGQQLSALEQQELKQKILLERFQREHPGFDFSNAKFNGSAPNARQFMGGINTGELNRNVSF
mmetsp:Transcript_31074/g.54570  ORF Transcript_31074/g.54570 Transcript_31074/m.54570 type:complete len:252 (-) Transcript_31074:112-867(-)|eukprot:CAMPEP_0197530880 /NCGR_PEP_ID=MMETSP1318-20131121/33244_1 /TAXON_ID=552666 /ORGANISM="Partenskyella glossopodia, Strain RCC365" /LENGTH=251 /DNA_ID=CAMNT_0043086871 /DNA_START=16 /DNA_END=774 /DNA_ORIENTATION=+